MTEQEQGAPERDTLLSQVEHSLAEAERGAIFAGVSALAEHYAYLIDQAAPERSYAKAIRVLGGFIDENCAVYAQGSPQQRELLEAWDKVSTALSQHSVASDLGPKLLAAMKELGLTVERGQSKPAAGGGQQTGGGTVTEMPKTPLQLLRGDARQRNAGAS